MATTTNDLWNVFNQKVGELAGGVDKTSQVMAFAGQANKLDLVSKDPWVINRNLFNVANNVPAWGPVYAPGKSDIVSAYTIFLGSIDPGGEASRSLNDQIDAAKGKMDAAQKSFNTTDDEAYEKWSDYKTKRGEISFQDYVQQRFPTWNDARRTLDAARSAYTSLMTQKAGVGYQIIQDAQDMMTAANARNKIESNRYNMPVSGDKNPGYQPEFTIDGFADTYTDGWQNNSVAHTFQTTLSMSGQDYAQSWDNFGWAASLQASYSRPFFRVGVSAQTAGSITETNVATTEFTLKVSYTGFGAFNIRPGQWYQDGLISAYHNKLRPNSPPFFGERGSLCLLPTKLILAMEPQIELGLTNTDFQAFRKVWMAQTAVSVGIGPFSLGVSAAFTGDKGDVQYHEDKNSITITPTRDGMPILLGVVCTKL